MMTSYFNLLKYAATGIASPDMTYYDKMRASMLMGGVVQTLTGIPPMTFKADGTPLISWLMKGNGQQTGTPSPDNITIPEMCGVRTGNLCDYTKFTGDIVTVIENGVNLSGRYFATLVIALTAGTAVSMNWEQTVISGSQNTAWRIKYTDNTYSAFISKNRSITLEKNAESILLYVTQSSSTASVDFTNIMLNSGSTALPYEPYGWKIPLTNAGQTVPVYLGHVNTVRRVKKLVLTGEETFTYYNTKTAKNVMNLYVPDSLDVSVGNNLVFCTHLPRCTQTAIYDETVERGISTRPSSRLLFYDTSIANTPDNFKSYLQQQYAAGHPVTVWYVLAEPETTISNEPLCKIGDYADELHSEDASMTIPTSKGQNVLTVDTLIQPSEMTITGRIQENV